MSRTPDFTSITGACSFADEGIQGWSVLPARFLSSRPDGIGALGATIQALATWAHRTKGAIQFDPAAMQIESEFLRETFTNDLALVAAALAKKILLRDTHQDGFMTAMLAARQAMAVRNSRQYLDASSCHILCLRHPYLGKVVGQSVDFDLNPQFFRSRDGRLVDSLRGLDEPETELFKIMELTFQRMRLGRDFQEGLRFTRILKAVFELFENANIWGLAPFAGMPGQTNVRGLYARFHEVRSRAHVERFASDPRLLNYLTQFTARPELKLTGFLELTVYDCGPGLAAMKQQAPVDASLPVREEYRLVMQCLKLRGTSRDSLNRGKGLHVVFTNLDELRAFLFLRSGRLTLCRDFWEKPFKEDSREPYQMDLFLGARPPPAAAPPVVGSVFVIVIPIFASAHEQTSLAF